VFEELRGGYDHKRAFFLTIKRRQRARGATSVFSARLMSCFVTKNA
jgi:hypothetical protein